MDDPTHRRRERGEGELMRTIIMLALAAMACTSCGPFGQGLNVDDLARSITEAVTPALAQVEGLTPEQVAAITSAIGEGIRGNLKLPEGGFDWKTPLAVLVGIVLNYFGVNAVRDRRRINRGEKV